MIPRNGVYHSPWAYKHRPTYGSLHFDQSEYMDEPGSTNHSNGLSFLTSIGEKPLRSVIAEQIKSIPAEEWRTILSGEEIDQAASQSTDELSARREKRRVIGIVSALEGIGFDSDLAFASWHDKQGDHALVPYDDENPLHRVAMAGFPNDTYETPGLEVQYSGQGKKMTVKLKGVDINERRKQVGEAIPVEVPNPQELAAQDYVYPRVLPSTQPHM